MSTVFDSRLCGPESVLNSARSIRIDKSGWSLESGERNCFSACLRVEVPPRIFSIEMFVCCGSKWSAPRCERCPSDFDLGAEFDDLPCRNAEKRRRSLCVMVEERKKRITPNRHADHSFAWNDRLATDVVADIRRIDA